MIRLFKYILFNLIILGFINISYAKEIKSNVIILFDFLIHILCLKEIRM